MDERHLQQMRGLHPDVSDEELKEAAENLDRHLEIAWEIWEEKNGGETSKH